MIERRLATLDDVPLIVAREAERIELWDGFGHTPDQAMGLGIALSNAETFSIDGEVAGMFGVVPADGFLGVGVPWAVFTSAIERHPTAFLRGGARWLRHTSQRFYRLVNVVDARNVQTVRWLEWLGFTVYDPMPFGPKQLPFRWFDYHV